MQNRIAKQIRKDWGEKDCPHPALDRRYFGGTQDGYVCIRCGAEFTSEQRKSLLAARLAEAGLIRNVHSPEERARELRSGRN